MKTATLALLVCSAPPCVAQLPDLIFERGNPNAFQTLQGALDASQPGQRILMRSSPWAMNASPHAVIRRSVTIQGEAGSALTIDREGQGIQIDSLTPGVPLVIRNVEIYYSSNSGYRPVAIRSGAQLLPSGALIVMDDVTIEGGVPTWGATMVALSCSRLSLTRCRIIGADLSNNNGCCGVWRTADGDEGLRFTGQSVYLEDTEIRGGNANVLYFPYSACEWQCPDGGLGGAAIDAPNAIVTAVRSFISDGNGGSVQAGNWYRPPQPGRVSPSRFANVVAYDFRHEAGRNDAGGQGVARGQVVRYGLRDAPLCIGPARIGRAVDVTIRPSGVQPVAIALGTRFVVSEPSSTIFGAVHVPLIPPPPVIYQGAGQTTLAIPPLPELVDQPLVGQLVGLYNGFPLLSNPSVSHIGR